MARHNTLGQWGEDLACHHLARQGYAIADRNWRMGHLELDIVAIRDGQIAFVEVKTRSDLDSDPVEAIDRRKILHITRSAEAYLRCHNFPHEPRFDVIAITGDASQHTLEHIEDAFDPPLKSYR